MNCIPTYALALEEEVIPGVEAQLGIRIRSGTVPVLTVLDLLEDTAVRIPRARRVAVKMMAEKEEINLLNAIPVGSTTRARAGGLPQRTTKTTRVMVAREVEKVFSGRRSVRRRRRRCS